MSAAELARLMLVVGVAAPVADVVLGGTTLGPIPVDRRVAARLYPRLWWLGPTMLAAGGLAVVLSGAATGPQRVTGAVAVVLAAWAVVRWRPPHEPVAVPRWVARLRRAAPITDTRRWRRLVVLGVGGVAMVAVAVLAPMSGGAG